MTPALLWSNIYARYFNVVMLVVYASTVAVPGNRVLLAGFSAISLAGGLGAHAYARRTGRLLQAVYLILWMDLLATWPAVMLTGMVTSPFMPILVLNVHTMYNVNHDLAMSRRFGWSTTSLLVVCSLVWWFHGRPGSGWDPAQYAGWTLLVFLIQATAFALAAIQVEQLSEPVVKELARQEEALANQARRAELGAALSMITHEIRTPLTTINGYLGLVEQQLERVTDPALRAAALRHVASAGQATTQLDAMLESVLSYAREKRGRYTFEACSCQEIIERAIGFIRLKHGRSGARLQVVVHPSEVTTVRCDRDAMHQVLVNLLENAVQHRNGARDLVIDLSVTPEAGGCRMTMRDNGRGIAPEVLPHLFGRFVSGRSGGTGLGLAIVRQVMTDHGGSIDVETTSEEGTTFVLRLPK